MFEHDVDLHSGEREEALRVMLDSTCAFVGRFTPDGVVIETNRAPLAAAGLNEADVVGRPFADTYWWTHSAEAQADVRRALARAAQGEIVRREFQVRLAGDGLATIDVVVAPVRDRSGHIVQLVATGVDVTGRTCAESARRDSEERFTQLTDAIRDVFWLHDCETDRLVYVSPSYERIWGRSCHALRDSPEDWIDAVHPADRERIRMANRTMLVSLPFEEEYRIVRPDGAVRWIRDQAFPFRDAGGRVIRIAGLAEDITERRQLEAQLRHAQKMESIGQLAGGIAHDFNNLLTVISGNAELLAVRRGRHADDDETVDEIRRAAERAAALTRQLLAFSRRQVLDPKVLGLNAIVLDAENMLRRLVGEDVVVNTVLGPAISRVRIDPGYLTQILMNLAVNARDAMPRGGQLTIETQEVTLDELYTLTHPRVQPGRYVLLAMSDTGSGMAADVRDRIFDPFFTTKDPGKGTGLGLAVVHGIVEQSGGHIDVYSEVGVGTTFKIYLPAVDAEPTMAAQTASGIPVRGTETVLLAEDDDQVRRLSARSLVDQGYSVVHAASGDDALRAVDGHVGRLDLLVTDVVMPGMNGRELAEVLRRRSPDIKVLYTSGYTTDAIVRHGILQEEVAFLQKPYTPLALVRKARELLDRV